MTSLLKDVKNILAVFQRVFVKFRVGGGHTFFFFQYL